MLHCSAVRYIVLQCVIVCYSVLQSAANLRTIQWGEYDSDVRNCCRGQTYWRPCAVPTGLSSSLCVRVCVRLCVCVYTHMFIYIYTHIYTHMYTHIYTFVRTFKYRRECIHPKRVPTVGRQFRYCALQHTPTHSNTL